VRGPSLSPDRGSPGAGRRAEILKTRPVTESPLASGDCLDRWEKCPDPAAGFRNGWVGW
jgi:hypothetical protein